MADGFNTFRMYMSQEELKRALLENREALFSLRDDEGGNILHYLARLGTTRGSSSICPILTLLFENAQRQDFELKNAEGQTPLHVAVSCCFFDRVTRQYVFPEFTQKAQELGFDFSIKDDNGNSTIGLLLSFLSENINNYSLFDNFLQKIVAGEKQKGYISERNSLNVFDEFDKLLASHFQGDQQDLRSELQECRRSMEIIVYQKRVSSYKIYQRSPSLPSAFYNFRWPDKDQKQKNTANVFHRG